MLDLETNSYVQPGVLSTVLNYLSKAVSTSGKANPTPEEVLPKLASLGLTCHSPAPEQNGC